MVYWQKLKMVHVCNCLGQKNGMEHSNILRNVISITINRSEFRISLPVHFAESPLENYHGITNPSTFWHFTKLCIILLTNENLLIPTSGQVSHYRRQPHNGCIIYSRNMTPYVPSRSIVKKKLRAVNELSGNTMWDWFLGMVLGTELVDDMDQVVTVLLHTRLVEALHLLQVLFRGRPN